MQASAQVRAQHKKADDSIRRQLHMRLRACGACALAIVSHCCEPIKLRMWCAFGIELDIQKKKKQNDSYRLYLLNDPTQDAVRALFI